MTTRNEWTRQAKQLFPRRREERCTWLAVQYKNHGGADRQKIKQAQKFLTCRQHRDQSDEPDFEAPDLPPYYPPTTA